MKYLHERKLNLGTKALNLIVLRENNFNVPEFEIISSDEMNDDSLKYNIDNIVKKLSSDTYAVRSSSNLEDGENLSFAGQFNTYLNVHKSDVYDKVIKCIDSLKNDNVKEYLRQSDVAEEVSMGVIIQKMLKPQKSGVIFTSNPQGILNEEVIIVGEGIGENIV